MNLQMLLRKKILILKTQNQFLDSKVRFVGLGTDKDEEVLAWAFNDERSKGDSNIFTTGNGDYIVAYLNGKQEAGIVRSRICKRTNRTNC